MTILKPFDGDGFGFEVAEPDPIWELIKPLVDGGLVSFEVKDAQFDKLKDADDLLHLEERFLQTGNRQRSEAIIGYARMGLTMKGKWEAMRFGAMPTERRFVERMGGDAWLKSIYSGAD